MTATDPGNLAVLDPYAPRPVDGHLDYEWYEDGLRGERHEVYWVPYVDACVRVGVVRPNPDYTPVFRRPAFVVEDAGGEWIASGDSVAEVARLLVLHHRTGWLAGRHATAAVDTVAASTDMDTARWARCVELEDVPTWWDEFGPFPQPLSGNDNTPTIHTLLRDLGVDPDQAGRPDGPLRPSLERYYERAYERAWYCAFLRAARSHLRTTGQPGPHRADGHRDHAALGLSLAAAA